MRVIYTCITGNYEKPHVPGYIPEGWKTVMFSDVPITSVGWMENIVIPEEHRHTDPRRTARKIKLLSHQFLPDADITFWMDANMQLTCDLNAAVNKFLTKYDLVTFQHPWRNCIYVEANSHVKLHRKDVASKVDPQMLRYRRAGYPRNNGLICSNVMLRRHTEAVKKVNELWWHELSRGSRRDQLSFNYAAWKLGFKYATFEKNHSKSLSFRYRPHGA